MEALDAVITPHDFLERLAIPGVDLRSLDHRQLAALYSLLIDFAEANGSARLMPEPPPPLGALEMRVSRTAFHVRLDAPSRQELETFLALAGVLMLGTGKPLTLTAAAAAALRDRIAKTQVKYGESSLVDVVLEMGSSTVDQIVTALNSHPCRHPGAGCRFEREGACGLKLEEARDIAESLTERKVLRHLNAYEPQEYGVVF